MKVKLPKLDKNSFVTLKSVTEFPYSFITLHKMKTGFIVALGFQTWVLEDTENICSMVNNYIEVINNNELPKSCKLVEQLDNAGSRDVVFFEYHGYMLPDGSKRDFYIFFYEHDTKYFNYKDFMVETLGSKRND